MEKFTKYQIVPEIEKNKYIAKFSISPLEKGFGITLGNAIRRVMLSSIPGVAIFAIKVPGITSETQTISGVKEDLLQIILNLKKLVIKIDDGAFSSQELEETKIEKWPTMNLKVASSSNGVVLAKDIELPPGFKIINPELHIATVAANTKFSMQIYATRGKGFKTFIQNRESLSSISAISTDSAFSPIIRVSYNVEEIKISRNNVGDKLIMDVVTNGSLTPTEAMAYAAKILTEHLNPIVNISKAISEIEIMNERDQQQKKQKLDTPIEELDFSVRSYNSLKRNGIHTVQDLTSMSKQKLENIRNLGKKSSREIVKRLQQMGLELVDDNK